MKATLKSVNYKDIEKTLIIIPRYDEILITTECGKEIATLSIGIAEKDIEVSPGEFKTEPSKDFYVAFESTDDNAIDHNVAYVCMTDEK